MTISLYVWRIYAVLFLWSAITIPLKHWDVIDRDYERSVFFGALIASIIIAWAITLPAARSRAAARQAELEAELQRHEPRRQQRVVQRRVELEERRQKLEEQQRLRQQEREERERQRQVEKQRQAEEKERVEREQQRREEEEMAYQRQQALIKRATPWIHRVELESNFLDSDYQKDFARANQSQILKELKPLWAREYHELMSDEDLKQHLQDNASQVIEWLRARQEVVRLAERFAVTPPPRPKPTGDQFLSRALREAKTQAEIEAAKFFAALDTELEIMNGLEAKELDIRRDKQLTDDQKEDRIRLMKTMTQLRLRALQEGQTDEAGEEKSPRVL